ncbi:DUF1513 domain-containing protein [Halopseudomonas nanhaiensis]|uniref:DUF1513 domain-containing protein n=1 Tax=Halopseudomonas nanhaiensis TaxID=2830842 RepID=UPI001CBD1BF2|nr:DUF1513 domain-containing protein [Halopseudomonas nanhaiensis]UAW99921.1 DUF1513 domain-containing protein [Halopseudomonas nanhaiensis]
MATRRAVLQGLLASLALSNLPWTARWASASTSSSTLLSAMTNLAGDHFICLEPVGDSAGDTLAVSNRCHGGCQRPGSDEAVVVERRPGRSFHVIQTCAGRIIRAVHAGEEHHFFGHAVFSHDGRRLYVTANHVPSGEGQLHVYDATAGYTLAAIFPVGGIDPHEIRLLPDGSRLVIAMGGILTHPDYDRIKLNLDTMQPAVIVMDRHEGRILQRHSPSHHQLSAHHLDVDRHGMVVVGYQYEGPEWEAPPLIGVLDSRDGTYREIAFNADEQLRLRNYIASVAVDPASGIAAVTAPRGNVVALFDYRTGELKRLVEVQDVAGVVSEGTGFIVSSGRGGLYRVDASHDKATLLNDSDRRWDNHLTWLSR